MCYLSSKLQDDFKALCQKFKERAEKRSLLKIVDHGLQRDPDLLKVIGNKFGILETKEAASYHRGSFCASDPAALGLILNIPKIFF